MRWRQPGRGPARQRVELFGPLARPPAPRSWATSTPPCRFQGPRRRLHFPGDTIPPTLEHQTPSATPPGSARRRWSGSVAARSRSRASSRASASATAATAASSVAAPLRASTTIQRSANTDAGAAPANFCTCVVVTDPSPLRALHWIATRDLSRLTATRSMPASWDGRGTPTVVRYGHSGALFLRGPLDHDAFDFVDRDRVRRAVVELRRLGRRMPRDLLGVLEGPPVREVRRDPRRPERVAARRRSLVSRSSRRRRSA